MVRNTLMGIAAIIAVPAALAGGYFLPHPPPSGPADPYDLPPASIVEWDEVNGEMPNDPAHRPLLRRPIPQAPHTVASNT